MTTPSDPNEPGYDQQSGLPRFPAAPPATEGPVQTYTPPTEITAAFWCYVVAAVITLVGGLFALGQKQTVLDSLRQNNNTNLTPSQLDTAATAAVTFAVVVAIIIAGLYLLFAFKLRAGRNWARIVLTVVAVLALLSLLFGNAHTALGYIGEVAAVVGAVLSWLPKSSAYIAAVKASRFR